MKQAVPLSRYLVFFALAAGGLRRRSGHQDAGCSPTSACRSTAGPPWWLWNGVFGFQTSLNEGALFGMGQGLWPLFAALSVGAAVGIVVWLFPAGAARDWLLTIALALVTAGILGNLYDRLGLPGWSGRPAIPATCPAHRSTPSATSSW